MIIIKGDSVWVRRAAGKGYYTDSVPITTFTGLLVGQILDDTCNDLLFISVKG